MSIGPSQAKLLPSESSHRAGYEAGIVRVLAPILGRSAASEKGNRFSCWWRKLSVLHGYWSEPNETTTIRIVSSSWIWGSYRPYIGTASWWESGQVGVG